MYDRVNRETLCQVLRLCDVGGKLLSGIKNIYVDILACVRVKGGQSERFRIDSGVKQECITSPWLYNLYMGAVMKLGKMGMGRREMSGYYLAFCMQMTWFCLVSLRRN